MGRKEKSSFPKTQAAACYLGQGTRWCTAATKAYNVFDDYNENGPLLVIIPAKPNHPGQKWQFHFHTNSLNDERDAPCTKTDIPETLWNVLLQWVERIPIEERIETLELEGSAEALRFIRKPTAKEEWAAVSANGYAIEFVECPSAEVQIAAVEDYCGVITLISNPCEAAQLAAVSQDGHIISRIRNPSEVVQLAAVQESGHAIQHILSPSKAVQMAAVEENPNAIQYIYQTVDRRSVCSH